MSPYFKLYWFSNINFHYLLLFDWWPYFTFFSTSTFISTFFFFHSHFFLHLFQLLFLLSFQFFHLFLLSLFTSHIKSFLQLTKKAEEILLAEKQSLKGFVTDWEEAELIKRKKKLRIARIEKSDEEISFEAGKKRNIIIWYCFHAINYLLIFLFI